MKSIVYIDGQNFIYKAAELLIDSNLISDKQELTSIDLDFLLHSLFPEQSLEIRYYGVKRIQHAKEYNEEIYQKSLAFSDNLRRLKSYLLKNNVTYIPKGSLKVRLSDKCKNCGFTDYKFQEKGVDVGLAVDIVKDSLKHETKHIILLSSDTDLIPALSITKEKQVKISYVAFSGQGTISLKKLPMKPYISTDDK